MSATDVKTPLSSDHAVTEKAQSVLANPSQGAIALVNNGDPDASVSAPAGSKRKARRTARKKAKKTKGYKEAGEGKEAKTVHYTTRSAERYEKMLVALKQAWYGINDACMTESECEMDSKSIDLAVAARMEEIRGFEAECANPDRIFTTEGWLNVVKDTKQIEKLTSRIAAARKLASLWRELISDAAVTVYDGGTLTSICKTIQSFGLCSFHLTPTLLPGYANAETPAEACSKCADGDDFSSKY
jgi:hypothetical protein